MRELDLGDARAVRAEGHAFKRYPDVASGRISAPAILLEDKDRRSDTKNSGGNQDMIRIDSILIRIMTS